jgi:hypothetical protein
MSRRVAAKAGFMKIASTVIITARVLRHFMTGRIFGIAEVV